MFIFRKVMKSKTGSSSNVWSDTNSVNNWPTGTDGGRHRQQRDSGVFDDSASLFNFGEQFSPPFDGVATGECEPKSAYMRSRPRASSSTFQRSGSVISRTSCKSDRSTCASSPKAVVCQTSNVAQQQQQQQPSTSNDKRATRTMPAAVPDAAGSNQTDVTSVGLYSMICQVAVYDPHQGDGVIFAQSAQVAKTLTNGHHPNAQDGTIPLAESPTVSRSAVRAPASVSDDDSREISMDEIPSAAEFSSLASPPEIRGSCRDGRLYTKKPLKFGVLSLLPNRYQQQQQVQQQQQQRQQSAPMIGAIKGKVINRSLDSSGFRPAVACSSASSPPSPHELTRSTTISSETPFPIPPPRRSRHRLSNRGSSMRETDFSEPINYRHSYAAPETILMMSTAFSDPCDVSDMLDSRRRQAVGRGHHPIDSDVSPADNPSAVCNLSPTSSIERDSPLELRDLSESSVSTVSSMSASVGYYSDVSSRTTISSSSSSSSSSSYRQYRVPGTAVPSDVDRCGSTASIERASDARGTASDTVMKLKNVTTLHANVCTSEAHQSCDETLRVVSKSTDSGTLSADFGARAGNGASTWFDEAVSDLNDTNCELQLTKTSTTASSSAPSVATGTEQLGPGNMDQVADSVSTSTTINDQNTSEVKCSTDIEGSGVKSEHQPARFCFGPRVDSKQTESNAVNAKQIAASTPVRPQNGFVELRDVDVFHSLHGKPSYTTVKLSCYTTPDDLIRRILDKEGIDTDHRLYQIKVKKSAFSSSDELDGLCRVDSPIDEQTTADRRLELIRRKSVKIKIVCDVGARRSRNLIVDVATDARGCDVIGAAIDRFKLTDKDASSYGLIQINKSTKEMRHVKHSEIVADFNNDYFLLCQKEHLANSKSDDSQPPELTASMSVDTPVVDARPDLLVVGGVAQLRRHPLEQANWKSLDVSTSSLSPPLSVTVPAVLSHSLSYGQLSPWNEPSYSPSSFTVNSAEILALQSRLHQLETESAAKERHWEEQMTKLRKSLKRFQTLAFTKDPEERIELMMAELDDLTADLKLQEQRVKHCQTRVTKHMESSVWLPEKIDELERKCTEALKRQSAAAEDRDKLVSMLRVLEAERQRSMPSTRTTPNEDGRSLYDVISALRLRSSILTLTINQPSLERFKCSNDDDGFLFVSETSDGTALQVGDRILELNANLAYTLTSDELKKTVQSAGKPCRLVVVRETGEEPTLLQDMYQWMDQFN